MLEAGGHDMDEHALRELVGDVVEGAVGNSVRGFDFSPFTGPPSRLVYWSREA